MSHFWIMEESSLSKEMLMYITVITELYIDHHTTKLLA
jgi:hypothetical protein